MRTNHVEYPCKHPSSHVRLAYFNFLVFYFLFNAFHVRQLFSFEKCLVTSFNIGTWVVSYFYLSYM
ncbi:hypothetical protein HanRHA438_Chr06g0279071 [Helianthus annuus]|nr:hypothetical protein HanRHA438_Chr06g0279071 [Helianthus annuus]